MSVKKDPSGRRTVDVEIDLRATPEQVWQAIATGPGIASWFVPADVDQREGGEIVFHLGPEGDSRGTITTWDPPRRFAYEERDWAPGAPPVATEITVEAREGGTCTVRLVHSLFASTDDWDDQLESFEAGWPAFFEVLALYLERYAGAPSALIDGMASAAMPLAAAWDALSAALAIRDAGEGATVQAADPALPALSGRVRRVYAIKSHGVLLDLDRPHPGAGLFGVYAWEGRVSVTMALYLYGEDAARVAARERPHWERWLATAPFAPAAPS